MKVILQKEVAQTLLGTGERDENSRRARGRDQWLVRSKSCGLCLGDLLPVHPCHQQSRDHGPDNLGKDICDGG